jgi:hypothetical protein
MRNFINVYTIGAAVGFVKRKRGFTLRGKIAIIRAL